MPEKKNPAREQLSYPVAEDIEGTLSILSALPCRPGTPLSVPLKDIPGRTAAASVKAPFSLPGFRRSRYDGFALSSAELLNASPATPVTLAVSAFLPAGSPLSSLAPGTCARIMTGAALPDGADCVVPLEEAGPEISRRVRFTAPASPGRCIGATDSDLATGETVIRKGSLLTPLSAARAALSGQTEIRVYPRPSAAVLSTGSELITPGTPSLREKFTIRASTPSAASSPRKGAEQFRRARCRTGAMRSRRESRRSSGKMTASSPRAAWEGETATSWPALSSGPASRLSRAAAGSGREAIFWLPLRGTNTFSLCQEDRDQPCWPCISSCFPACAGLWAGRLSCLRPRRPFSGSSRHAGPAASPRGISVSREAGPSFIRGASGTLNSRGSAPYSPSGETSPSETG